MRSSTQLRTQTKFALLAFRRNPASTFFTVVLPIVFLLLFSTIFGNNTLEPSGVRVATFYVGGILALSIISSTFQNLAITTVVLRETNVLKRVRGTPLRPWVFITGHIGAALVISVLMTVIVIAIGRLLFDVGIITRGLPALAISLAVGTAAFCALGLALSAAIPSANAAPGIVNIITLPLMFVSDVFIPPQQETPKVIETIGNLFPVKHLANALFESFDPFTSGTPMPWGHWAVVAGWGVVGAAIAVRKFRWT